MLTFNGKYLFTSWLKSGSFSLVGNNSHPFVFSSPHNLQRDISHINLVNSILFSTGRSPSGRFRDMVTNQREVLSRDSLQKDAKLDFGPTINL